MEIEPKMSAALGDFKTQLENLRYGNSASANQLAFFSFSVGSAFYEENSQITSRFVVLPGKFCTTPRTLLDATGRTSTGADGKRVFRLSDFICSSLNSFSEPIFLLATPTASPCYITLTHQLIKDPNNPNSFNDVEITAFTWKPGGDADPNIAFD